MRRRTLLAGTVAFLAAPLVAEAQPATRVWRIGLLAISLPNVGYAAAMRASFRSGMRDLGYVEGVNVVLELRNPRAWHSWPFVIACRRCMGPADTRSPAA